MARSEGEQSSMKNMEEPDGMGMQRSRDVFGPFAQRPMKMLLTFGTRIYYELSEILVRRRFPAF